MFSRSKSKPEDARDSVPGSTGAASAAAPDAKAVRGVSPTPATQKPSVISEGLVMRGDVISGGILHVEGGIIGTVRVDDAHVSAGGFIEGELNCHSLSLKGRFDGELVCDELVVASSARITGRVAYRYISISSGAQVEAEIEWRTPAQD
jgi:cytoskeletal protein CcmA (bactofilin family)